MKYIFLAIITSLLVSCVHKYVMQNCMRVVDKEAKVIEWVCER